MDPSAGQENPEEKIEQEADEKLDKCQEIEDSKIT
jgi:hypothetical protein